MFNVESNPSGNYLMIEVNVTLVTQTGNVCWVVEVLGQIGRKEGRQAGRKEGRKSKNNSQPTLLHPPSSS